MELDCGEYAFKGSTWLANITARWVITTVYGKGVPRQGYLDRGTVRIQNLTIVASRLTALL